MLEVNASKASVEFKADPGGQTQRGFLIKTEGRRPVFAIHTMSRKTADFLRGWPVGVDSGNSRPDYLKDPVVSKDTFSFYKHLKTFLFAVY